MSGSNAASMFGGVLTGSAAGNFLTKMTAWLATIFFILCALLSLVVAKTNVSKQHQSELRQELASSMVVDQKADETPAQSTPVERVKTDTPAEPAKADKK